MKAASTVSTPPPTFQKGQVQACDGKVRQSVGPMLRLEYPRKSLEKASEGICLIGYLSEKDS